MPRSATRPEHSPGEISGETGHDGERDGAPVRFVLFVDAGLPDRSRLLAGVPHAGRAFVVPRDTDAAAFMVERVFEVLRNPFGLEEIGIVAHGGPGHVLIGSQRLCLPSLPLMVENLRALGDLLSPEGRLRLLACEVAAGDDGAAFVAALAQTLQRRVLAASARLGNGRAVMDTLVEPNGSIRRVGQQ